MANNQKSDILFLIVGTNPFPNLLACLMRVKEDGEVYLMHTKDGEDYAGTEKIAERLRKIMEEKQKESDKKIIFHLFTIARSDPWAIRKTIFGKLKDIKSRQKNKTIELNYTGGTKAMTVHTYAVFREFEKENRDIYQYIYSYIDGEQECIFYEHTGANCKKKCEDLKELSITMPLDLKDICEIHGNDLSGKLVNKTIDLEHLEAAQQLYQIVCNTNHKKLIPSFEKIYNISDDVYRNKNLKKLKTKNVDEVLDSIQGILKSRDDTSLMIMDNKKNKQFNIFEEYKLNDFYDLVKDKKNPYEFLDKLKGKWLEDYVLHILQGLKERNDDLILDYGNSIEPLDANNKARFEVDLAVIRKYKFYAISTTMQESKAECKFKLFEIKERAAQLGGQEAGIALICFYKNSRVLLNEIKETWKTVEPKNILVIGWDQFEDMPYLLEQWIKGEMIG